MAADATRSVVEAEDAPESVVEAVAAQLALADSGRQVSTSTAHVEPTEGWRSQVQAGESVIVAEGDFKGEQGVVVGDAGLIGQRILVRLDSGREIDTKESHVSPCRPG